MYEKKHILFHLVQLFASYAGMKEISEINFYK